MKYYTHSFQMDQFDKSDYSAENIRTMVLLQGILRKPSSSFSVVHSGAVVRERQAGERLILLSVEAVSVIRNRQRRGIPPFSERLVVVAFEHLAPRIYDRAHAAQMVRQEITDLGFIVDRPHDPPAAERRTLEYSIRLGTFIRTICKKNLDTRNRSRHQSSLKVSYRLQDNNNLWHSHRCPRHIRANSDNYMTYPVLAPSLLLHSRSHRTHAIERLGEKRSLSLGE